jgi:hypothetical protein
MEYRKQVPPNTRKITLAHKGSASINLIDEENASDE